MKLNILYASFILLFACNVNSGAAGDYQKETKEKPLPATVVYDYDCLEGKANITAVEKLQDAGVLLRRMTSDKIEVTDAEQSQLGDEFLTELKSGNTFKLDSTNQLNEKLQFILNDLLRKRIDPTTIKYSIHLIDDTKTVNAFTYGGKIFVTKAITERCKTDDELYAIIGHEVGHNEKGHIKRGIQELKYTQQYVGKHAKLITGINKTVFAVFYQKSELEADYYGLNLVYMLGKNPCAISTFWEAMAKDEGQYSALEDFMRSHPFSTPRAQCVRHYVETNFSLSCK